MSLSINLIGHVKDSEGATAATVEQQMSDDLVAFVKKYAPHIEIGEASFQYAENLDLAAIARDQVANPSPVATPAAGAPDTKTPEGNATGNVSDPVPLGETIDDAETPVIEVPPDASAPAADQSTPPSTPTPTADESAPAGDGSAPAPFVTKVEGEGFADYQTRLWNYNESVPLEQQAPSLSEDNWNSAPVG